MPVEVECDRRITSNVDACRANCRVCFRSRTLIGPGIDAGLAGEGRVSDGRRWSKPLCNGVTDRSFGRWRDGHNVENDLPVYVFLAAKHFDVAEVKRCPG